MIFEYIKFLKRIFLTENIYIYIRIPLQILENICIKRSSCSCLRAIFFAIMPTSRSLESSTLFVSSSLSSQNSPDYKWYAPSPTFFDIEPFCPAFSSVHGPRRIHLPPPEPLWLRDQGDQYWSLLSIFNVFESPILFLVKNQSFTSHAHPHPFVLTLHATCSP